jgi:hypothetical protein
MSYTSNPGFDILSNASAQRHSALKGLTSNKNTGSQKSIQTFGGHISQPKLRSNNKEEWPEPDFLQ